jgi:S-adenosylmethionine:tRNA ribosyltransferase-isomerase
MLTSDFDYDLPPDRIAQTPIEPRHDARLMVLRRGQTLIEDSIFKNLAHYLTPGDLLVINQTRVIPARLFARKPTGGKVELLLLKRLATGEWEALVGGRHLHTGTRLTIEDGPEVEISAEMEGSRRILKFLQPVEGLLPSLGEMTLPPYIHTRLTDPERYQTVYAQQAGSAAAATAGLHFTTELMRSLEAYGLRFAKVTPHVGLDTFAPVTETDPNEHKIHTEWCEVTEETAELINQTRASGGKIVAVGTTSVRTLESSALASPVPGRAVPISGSTGLYILPGFQFKLVDALITNFHLPKSTLLMLVSAFAGREKVLAAYAEAVRLNYRFYSFGDAMLIL